MWRILWHITSLLMTPNTRMCTHTYFACTLMLTYLHTHTLNNPVSPGNTGRCLLGSMQPVSNYLLGSHWASHDVFAILLSATAEMYTTAFNRLFCSLLIMSSHCDAVLYILYRFTVLSSCIYWSPSRGGYCFCLLSVGRRLFTETLDAALGKPIDR